MVRYYNYIYVRSSYGICRANENGIVHLKFLMMGQFLLEALIELLIKLPLYYAMITTCIAGTSLHQLQLIVL